MNNNPDAILNTARAALPAPLSAALDHHWDALCEQARDWPAGEPGWLSTVPAALAVSDFVRQALVRAPELLPGLVSSGELFQASTAMQLAERMQQAMQDVADEAALMMRLRGFRRREMVRLAWRDLAGWADLDEVMTTLSALADNCIDTAYRFIHRDLVGKHGLPRDEDSAEPAVMTVVAMGKLGGGELNFSSDIDLMFFYSADGETDGERGLSNHEFFARLGKRLIKVLGENTADGFVFRVDMRLRPNGDSGPLALSFDGAEHYYQTHGREWERYAMIKARACAGEPGAGEQLLTQLRPFVYRRYLDYGAFESIRGLKGSINQELSRKGIENNIKLGPGGIREIEFIAQAFQLIRGGREPELQSRSVLKTLAHLAARELLTQRAVDDLLAAYDFLRRSEHRLQMVADQQTQLLPGDETGRARLAFSMGFEAWPAYEKALRQHMRRVHGHFSQVFEAPQEQDAADEQTLTAVWNASLDDDTALARLRAAGYREDAGKALSLIQGLRRGSIYKAFSTEGRLRMDRLMPLLLAAAGLSPHGETTLQRLIRLLEAIGRRSAYLALMFENPMVLSQLVKLCAASPWITDWIASHPLLLDELLNPVDTYRSQSREQLAAGLAQRLARAPREDLERQMELLREFCNSRVLQIAATDVGPGLPAREVGQQLSLLADVLIEASQQLAFDALASRHGRPVCRPQQGADYEPGFAVIAYGKLGGLELGYGSDVDIIFLYDDCRGHGETDGERPVALEVFYARLGQRLIHILTTRMTGGILYEADMRLRPSGQSGPLATSLPAFQCYQQEHAWTWEHQALVRARAVCGDPAVIAAFNDIRRSILCQPRDPVQLAREVVAMREKMMHNVGGDEEQQFDIKLEQGGIVDIEFMVQYWVLRRAHEMPALVARTDNIGLLEMLSEAGHVPAWMASTLINAYTRYLSAAYRLKLLQEGSVLGRSVLGDIPYEVAAIWNQVFAGVDPATDDELKR